MFYLICLDVQQPEGMSLSEFQEIWHRNAVATQKYRSSGSVQSFKAVGRWTIFSIAEFPDNDSLDEALAGLPIVEDLGSAVEIEVIPVRPYAEIDTSGIEPMEPEAEPEEPEPGQITQAIRSLEASRRTPVEPEKPEAADEPEKPEATAEPTQPEVRQEQPKEAVGEITEAIQGLEAMPLPAPTEPEEPEVADEPRQDDEAGQITDMIEGLETAGSKQPGVGEITEAIQGLDPPHIRASSGSEEPKMVDDPGGAASSGEAPPPTTPSEGGSITDVIRSLDAPSGEQAGPEEQATAPAATEPEAPLGPQVLLRFVSGSVSGETRKVGREGATIGRSPDNSMRIADERLSRRHAQIEFKDNGYWLNDLGSRNGTFVNETRLLEPHHLQSGDVIRVGSTRLSVSLEDEPAN